jgi:TPR repeat protein
LSASKFFSGGILSALFDKFRRSKIIQELNQDRDPDILRGLARATGEAISVLEKAAEEGDAKAQFSLGIYYLIGRGVKQNLEKAFDLLSAAKRAGDDEVAAFCDLAAAEREREKKEARRLNEVALESMMEAKRRQLFPKPILITSED